MDKELFEIMISDWLADNEGLVLGEIVVLEDGRWAIEAEEGDCLYLSLIHISEPTRR